MASTHTIAENELAKRYGFRWFRSGAEGSEVAEGELVCPASEAEGFRLTCETCLACSGGQNTKISVFNPVHGSLSTISSFNKAIA